MPETRTVVKTAEEGFDSLAAFLQQPAAGWGYRYGLLSRDADIVTVTLKTSKPCFGELRPYKTEITSTAASQVERKKDYHPGDLPDKFPTGEILGLAVPVLGSDQASAGFGVFLDKDFSPWRSALKDAEVVKLPENKHGLLFRETDLPPTVLVSLLMNARSWSSQLNTRFLEFQKHKPDAVPSAHLLGALLIQGEYIVNPYYQLKASGMSISSFVNCSPYDLDGGETIRNRAAYNRPWIHDLFGQGHKNKLGLSKTDSAYNNVHIGKDHLKIFETILEEAAKQKPDDPSGEGLNIIKSCGDKLNFE